MQAGRLRHTITLQREQVTRDAAGQEVVTWEKVATIWARVEISQAAREGFVSRSDQIQATANYKITTRQTTQLQPTVKDRIKWGPLFIDVQTVISDPVRRQWVILGTSVI